MPPSKGCYVTLPTPSGNQRWRICFAPLRDRYGECDWSSKTIRLDPGQPLACLLDTVLHEIAHVCSGDALSEALIEKIAAGGTAALLRLGMLGEED